MKTPYWADKHKQLPHFKRRLMEPEDIAVSLIALQQELISLVGCLTHGEEIILMKINSYLFHKYPTHETNNRNPERP